MCGCGRGLLLLSAQVVEWTEGNTCLSPPSYTIYPSRAVVNLTGHSKTFGGPGLTTRWGYCDSKARTRLISLLFILELRHTRLICLTLLPLFGSTVSLHLLLLPWGKHICLWFRTFCNPYPCNASRLVFTFLSFSFSPIYSC